MESQPLDFEKPILELQRRLQELKSHSDKHEIDFDSEVESMELKIRETRREIYENLTAWQRVQIARHVQRPFALDYIARCFTEWIELHGDRVFGDDKAMPCGLAKLGAQRCVVIAQQKGRDTKENVKRNFGCAYPGLGAEERGQGEAIARNLREMAGLGTPIVCVVTGEGGSGGALAIGVGNRVLMLEHAIYSVISPEGCAAILWGEASKAPEAAELMRVTAPDLLRLGVIDGIVPEPVGGAHRNWEETAENLRGALRGSLQELRSRSPESLVADRYEKFRKIGVFADSG